VLDTRLPGFAEGTVEAVFEWLEIESVEVAVGIDEHRDQGRVRKPRRGRWRDGIDL
jgi:hypothetical protein